MGLHVSAKTQVLISAAGPIEEHIGTCSLCSVYGNNIVNGKTTLFLLKAFNASWSDAIIGLKLCSHQMKSGFLWCIYKFNVRDRLYLKFQNLINPFYIDVKLYTFLHSRGFGEYFAEVGVSTKANLRCRTGQYK